MLEFEYTGEVTKDHVCLDLWKVVETPFLLTI